MGEGEGQAAGQPPQRVPEMSIPGHFWPANNPSGRAGSPEVTFRRKGRKEMSAHFRTGHGRLGSAIP